MRLTLHLRHQIARLALCVIAFAALAPAITHWLAAGGASSAWTEICTAAGIQRIALSTPQQGDSSTDSSGTATGHDQCPFCRLQHDLPLLTATTAGQFTPAAPTGAAPPPGPSTALPSGSPWTHAPSRAPPRFA